MTRSRGSLTLIAAATTAVLATAGLTAVSVPAHAVSNTLTYSCTSSPDIGTHVFTAVIDTDAPATLGSGLSANIATTSTVTVPEAIADQLRGAGTTTVDGTSTATGTVDGVPRQSSLTIPKTPVPPDGTTMQVVGTGPSGSITAGGAGTTILLGAGSFTATVTGYNSAGTALVPAYTFTCSLEPASQNLLVDTVAVVPAATTTAVTVQNAPVQYGDMPSVTAEVTAPGKGKPDGKIAFTYGGKTVTIDVKGGKAKATSLPSALKMGANSVSAVFTPADKNLATSEAAKAFTVVKADSIASTSAVYRPAADKIVAKTKVTSAYATPVDGVVKYVLKRDGVKIRTKTVELNKFDVARRVFKNIRKSATYTVVARYQGSNTLRRSVDRFKLNVTA